jgi:methionyl-tRNA formyltransferase
MNFKVVFFGTPQIAARCLQALLDSNVNVAAVVTKVDKPIGRKQIIIDNEVKQLAKQHNIKVLQPNKLLEIYDELMQIKPDLIVVCAFGKIIPEKILNIPQFHCVNIHTSLLPR